MAMNSNSAKLKDSISVSKRPLAPESAHPRRISRRHALRFAWKFLPSSKENSQSMIASTDCVWSAPGAGGDTAVLNSVWRRWRNTVPLLKRNACSGADANRAMGDGNSGVGACSTATVVGSRRSSTRHESAAGSQVWPPSRLSSVKMSKKLLIMQPPGTVRRVAPPSDALVGLSRNCTEAGRLPLKKSSRSISVSKNCTVPVGVPPVVRSVICDWQCIAWNVAPPSRDRSSMASQPILSVVLVPGAGGGSPPVKARSRRSLRTTPLANCDCHGAMLTNRPCGGSSSASGKNISKPGVSDGCTVTVKRHSAVWPQASVAVETTVVTPTGNRLPLGGTLVTVTGAQPPSVTGAA